LEEAMDLSRDRQIRAWLDKDTSNTLWCHGAGYSGDDAELRQHLKSRRETSLVVMLPAIIAQSVHTLDIVGRISKSCNFSIPVAFNLMCWSSYQLNHLRLQFSLDTFVFRNERTGAA
jgi:hypothetical protein